MYVAAALAQAFLGQIHLPHADHSEVVAQSRVHSIRLSWTGFPSAPCPAPCVEAPEHTHILMCVECN